MNELQGGEGRVHTHCCRETYVWNEGELGECELGLQNARAFALFCLFVSLNAFCCDCAVHCSAARTKQSDPGNVVRLQVEFADAGVLLQRFS